MKTCAVRATFLSPKLCLGFLYCQGCGSVLGNGGSCLSNQDLNEFTSLHRKFAENPLAKVYYETLGSLIRETPVSHLRGRIKTSNCLKRCALLLQKSLVFSHQRCSAFLIRLDFTQHRACPKHLHLNPLRMTAYANEVLPPPPAAPSLRVAGAPADAEHGKVLCTGVLWSTTPYNYRTRGNPVKPSVSSLMSRRIAGFGSEDLCAMNLDTFGQ